jgi:hypothetical protein
MPMSFEIKEENRPKNPRHFKQSNATKNCIQVMKKGHLKLESTVLFKKVRDNDTTK